MTDAETIRDLAAKLDACAAARMHDAERYAERVDELTAALDRVAELEHSLTLMLRLVTDLEEESMRTIEWGEEDRFRMGEWFSSSDQRNIRTARDALAPKGAAK